MKTFHIDANDASFARVVNSAFAGLTLAVAVMANTKGVSKKQALKEVSKLLEQTNVAIDSEFIRAQLIKKDLIKNDPTLFCAFDPSDDNSTNAVKVYEKDELGKGAKLQ